MAKKKRRAKGEGSIFRRSDGRWQGSLTVGYDPDGRQKKRVVYGKTKAEAFEKLDRLRQQQVAGTLPKASIALGPFFAHWLAEKERQVKPRTAEFYRTYADRHILPNLGGTKLEALTPLHVQNLMGQVAGQVSSDAANKCRTVLRAALNQAVKWQLLARNPVDAVEAYKVDRQGITMWTPSQARTFLAAAEGDRLFAAFYLAMATGMRHGEVLGLTWSDVGREAIYVRQSLIVLDNRPHISVPKTETGQRRIAVAPDTLEVLEAHRLALRALLDGKANEYDLVFTTLDGKPLHPRNFDRTWYRLQEAAGVPRIRFHDLRHMHVSLLVKSGFDPRTVADRVGHTDASFTLRKYSHMFDEQRQAAAVSLEALLGPLGADKV